MLYYVGIVSALLAIIVDTCYCYILPVVVFVMHWDGQ